MFLQESYFIMSIIWDIIMNNNISNNRMYKLYVCCRLF